MARRRRPVRGLDVLEVARLADELYPRPDWTGDQWAEDGESYAAISRQRREFAASHGYDMLELLQAQSELRVRSSEE